MSLSQVSRSLRVPGTLNGFRSATFLSPRISYAQLQTRLIATTPSLHQQQQPQQQQQQQNNQQNQSTASSPPSTSPTERATRIAANPTHQTTANISKTGLSDKPLELESTPEEKVDWTRSFHGLSAAPFPKEVADILLGATDPEEVEIKPDGIVYLPEIKYRRILNRAFGPGAWGLVPRSESIVTPKTVTREYALVCNGR